MALEDELATMPQAYAVALRLEALGAEPALIAAALGIEREAVPTLLDVAHRKLAEIADVTKVAPPPRRRDGQRGEPS
jgi:hypothetical protein